MRCALCCKVLSCCFSWENFGIRSVPEILDIAVHIDLGLPAGILLIQQQLKTFNRQRKEVNHLQTLWLFITSYGSMKSVCLILVLAVSLAQRKWMVWFFLGRNKFKNIFTYLVFWCGTRKVHYQIRPSVL